MTFEEMMHTLGHALSMIPRRTSDAHEYRGLFSGCKRGRGSFGGPIGNGGPSVPPHYP